MLQLVRMDGQDLQTLYCLPSSVTSASVQWSTDQKSALISTDASNSISTVTLLTLATGSLQTDLHITDINYSYTVLTWLDTTRAYVIKTGRSDPQPPITLYLLATASHTLTQVLSTPSDLATYPWTAATMAPNCLSATVSIRQASIQPSQ